MHELVMRIKKAELCYVFARNAVERGHEELAVEAYRRAGRLDEGVTELRNLIGEVDGGWSVRRRS